MASYERKLAHGGLSPPFATRFALDFARHLPCFTQADVTQSPAAHSTLTFDIFDGCSWPRVKLKLPSLTDSSLGWHVELRCMETQLTDLESAALYVSASLVGSNIIKQRPNLYVPLVSVEEGFDRAHHWDAVLNEKLEWRRYPLGTGDVEILVARPNMDHVINGSGEYVGILSLIKRYMNIAKWSDDEKARNKPHLDLASKRASGKYWAAFKWVGEVVRDYGKDSEGSGGICHAMTKELLESLEGTRTGRKYEKASDV